MSVLLVPDDYHCPNSTYIGEGVPITIVTDHLFSYSPSRGVGQIQVPETAKFGSDDSYLQLASRIALGKFLSVMLVEMTLKDTRLREEMSILRDIGTAGQILTCTIQQLCEEWVRSVRIPSLNLQFEGGAPIGKGGLAVLGNEILHPRELNEDTYLDRAKSWCRIKSPHYPNRTYEEKLMSTAIKETAKMCLEQMKEYWSTQDDLTFDQKSMLSLKMTRNVVERAIRYAEGEYSLYGDNAKGWSVTQVTVNPHGSESNHFGVSSRFQHSDLRKGMLKTEFFDAMDRQIITGCVDTLSYEGKDGHDEDFMCDSEDGEDAAMTGA